MLSKVFKVLSVFSLIGCMSLSVCAIDEKINNNANETTVTYNTDQSGNYDLVFNDEIYTVNLRIKGNWELKPVESTYYQDPNGYDAYTEYNASWDEDDFILTIDSGNAIKALVDKVVYSHKKENDYLTAKVTIKFQKASETNSKIWRYKTVTMEVEQLEIPVTETIEKPLGL